MISIRQRRKQAQRGSVTCPRSHSPSMAEPTFVAWPGSLKPEPAVCPLQAGRPGPPVGSAGPAPVVSLMVEPPCHAHRRPGGSAAERQTDVSRKHDLSAKHWRGEVIDL